MPETDRRWPPSSLREGGKNDAALPNWIS